MLSPDSVKAPSIISTLLDVMLVNKRLQFQNVKQDGPRLVLVIPTNPDLQGFS